MAQSKLSKKIILVSQNALDFTGIARLLGAEFKRHANWSAIPDNCDEGVDCLLLWAPFDCEKPRPKAGVAKHGENDLLAAFDKLPPPQRELLHRRPERAVLVTAQPIYNDPDFSAAAPILRKYFHSTMTVPGGGEVSNAIYARLFEVLLDPKPRGVTALLGNEPLEKMVISKPSQRPSVVSDIEKLGVDRECSVRVARRAADAANELLMNAIYDAAVDELGRPLRNGFDRTADFSFGPNERILLEAAVTHDCFGISVTDGFGSIDQERIFSCVDKNYAVKDYQAPESTASAELGLYSLVRSGCSLVITSQHGVRTDCIALMPVGASARDPHNYFHFTSILSSSPYASR